MILTERTYKKIHNTVKIKLVWRREEMCAASLTYTECILTVWRNSGIPSVYVTRDTTDHQSSPSSPHGHGVSSSCLIPRFSSRVIYIYPVSMI